MKAGAYNAQSPLVSRVFVALSDGEFHSGEELAESLGVSRSAVWKAAQALRELGMPMHAVRNRGYRWPNATDPLDASRIRSALPRRVRDKLARLDVAWCVDSTNTALVERPNPPVGKSEVLLAEFQTAGRGRRGRTWFAPPGGAVCLSLSWTFPQVPRDVGSLSLAIGVCVLRALGAHGVQGVRLKWPNDVLLGDHKLGGILIELRAESAGPASVVIGIGLNVALGADLIRKIAATGIRATDLSGAGLQTPARNLLVARLIECCVNGLQEFEKDGLRSFVDEWRHADALRGREITVSGMEEVQSGVSRGIDLSGALLVETRNGLKKFISGEVTVRPVA
ncbi:MAG TPA: biotin--[acetyl-CoA-carboxylase] ligase [Steroidobacteraceae bacterium]